MNFSPRRSLIAGACFLIALALFSVGYLLSRGTDAIPGRPQFFVGGGDTPVPTVRTTFTRVAESGEAVQPVASATPRPAGPSSTPQPRTASGPSRVYLPVVGAYNPPGLDRQPFDVATATPTATTIETATAAATSTPVTVQPVLTPLPTPTPQPTRGPPRITKLGLGVYASGGGMLPVLDQSRPSIILLMDPTVDFAQEVRKRFPKSFIVGRIFATDQPLDNPAQRGTDFAERVAVLAVPLKGVVDAWMSYNEVGNADDPVGLTNYNTFQVAFAHRLQDTYGIAAVAANDGPRALPAEYYVKYYGEAIRVSRYFGLHIYPNADIKSLRDPNAADQVFFYRKIHDALEAAGIKAGPYIVTELGLFNGWRGVESDNDMATDFTWIADQMNADPYVLGATVFGVFRKDDRWGNFEVDGSNILNVMGDYNSVH